jgi:hypothetical protein
MTQRWTKDLNGHFSKEDLQIVYLGMKITSNWEMTSQNLYIPIRMTIIKEQ